METCSIFNFKDLVEDNSALLNRLEHGLNHVILKLDQWPDKAMWDKALDKVTLSYISVSLEGGNTDRRHE